MELEIDRVANKIVNKFCGVPDNIIAAARAKGIKTESWSIAARELAKIELKGKNYESSNTAKD